MFAVWSYPCWRGYLAAIDGACVCPRSDAQRKTVADPDIARSLSVADAAGGRAQRASIVGRYAC
jgi:hypothetical protein